MSHVPFIANQYICFILLVYCKFLEFFFSRSILWMPRFGMPYTLQYLEAFMVRSVALERLVKLYWLNKFQMNLCIRVANHLHFYVFFLN